MKIFNDFLSEDNEYFESKAPSNLSQKDRCKILVIDDDPQIQRLIGQTLAPQASVLQELNGESEFMEVLDLDNIDAVVLDHKLCGEADGLEILKRIREKYEDLPILFMTAYGDHEVARRAIAVGVNEYFPKPFDAADLRMVVSKWVPMFDATKKTLDLKDLSPSQPMSELIEAENFLSAQGPNGEDFVARVLHYNSRSVVVEAPLGNGLSVGDHLEDTNLTLGFRCLEVVGAVVYEITDLDDKALIEVNLPGIWKIEGEEHSAEPEEVFHMIRSRKRRNLPDYSLLDQGMRERKSIPPEYRSTILDIESILLEFHNDLAPFEKLINEVGADERAKMEEQVIAYSKGRFFPTLTDAVERFEKAAAAAVAEGLREPFRNVAQKRLFPMILCSPFFARVISQPIGVPGDFGILGQLLGNPYEGHSLFGRMLNAWLITGNSAAAYRHRIELLGGQISQTAMDASAKGQKARVLSMASGVAYEVQDFIRRPINNPCIDFNLVDFSLRTLSEAKSHFSDCKRFFDPSGIDVHLRQGSVIDLAKSTKRKLSDSEQGQYDLVYCAGLFDYLSDRMCSKVVSYLYGLTKPGGKVIVSNYTPHNKLRYFMGLVLDWELIHRTTDQFDSLMKGTTARDNYEIVEDDTKTELYAIAQKE